jgi:lactoylglutathione lyase
MARIGGVGLHVQDLARSVDFYTQVLGMKETARYELAEFDEVLLGYGEGPDTPSMFLVGRADHEGPYSIGDGFYKVVLTVDDARAICDQVAAWGCAVERGPIDLPEHGLTMAMVFDPDGYRVELLEHH